MARKNRIVVENGLYHVTTRIAHKAFMLADEKVKERIVAWMYNIADFAGIEVAAWSIMDNHLHLLLQVPTVPERYWTDVECMPSVSLRSMRPAECRIPRWSNGDCPSISGGCPSDVGFTMSDEEMLVRLKGLYSDKLSYVRGIAKRWANMRTRGCGEVIEQEKAKFCRRMYSISQYMHTLKQRISEYFNRELGHEGQLWEGRFHSSLVEKEYLAKLFVSAYIEWNASKAGLAKHPKAWKWCSYSVACGDGIFANRACKGYETLFMMPWEKVKIRLEAAFADKLPQSWKEEIKPSDAGPSKLRMAQLIKAVSLSHSAYFSRRRDFVKETISALPQRFPAAGGRVVDFLSRFDWKDPLTIVA